MKKIKIGAIAVVVTASAIVAMNSERMNVSAGNDSTAFSIDGITEELKEDSTGSYTPTSLDYEVVSSQVVSASAAARTSSYRNQVEARIDELSILANGSLQYMMYQVMAGDQSIIAGNCAENVYTLNIRDDAYSVKDMIVKNAVVAGAIYYNSSYYTDSNRGYYSPENKNANTAVVLIGWDDNYSFSNSSAKPSQKGAWLAIVPETRATLWISYEEATLTSAVYAFEPVAKNYSNVYQHDASVVTQLLYSDATDVSIANVYTVSSDSEYIDKISFQTMQPDLEYQIKVYKNLTNGSNPESGALVLSKIGKTSRTGYLTVDVTESVPLQSSEDFSVVINLKNNYYDSYIPVEGTMAGSGDVAKIATAAAGESFVKAKGSGWEDSGILFGVNNRIKVYTTNKAPEPAKTEENTTSSEDKKAAEEKAAQLEEAKKTAQKAPTLSNTTKGVKVSWKKVSGATKYTVYRSTDGKTWKSVYSTKNTSWTDEAAVGNCKTYCYYVVTNVSSTKINSKTSKYVYLTRPAISSATKKSTTSFVVKYKKNSKASGYIIQYSTKSDFTKAKEIDAKTKVSYTVKSLKKKTKYYVRVRSYKKSGNKKYVSAWSKTKVIKL